MSQLPKIPFPVREDLRADAEARGGGETERVLREVFGHEAFREGQERVVRGLLEGRAMLAIFPTGGGKSLCYQLPAVVLGGLTVVVSPLIALMKDQVDALERKGVAAARLDGTLSEEEQRAVEGRLGKGEIRLLYVSPERFTLESWAAKLKKWQPAMVAVDEAHCISEWGHHFRPDYLKIAMVCRRLKVKRVLALTATATRKAADEIRKGFGIRKADACVTGFHRRNLELRVRPMEEAEKKEHLLSRLQESDGATIVYVTLQQTAEEVATWLKRRGVSAQAYHAGLPDEFRTAAQEAFMRGEIRVMAATIAFGMGIDKADIRQVFHYNLPKSLENYVQETGRAGRDGKAAVCELLACRDDLVVLENFVHGDFPGDQAVSNLLDHVLRLGQEFQVSVYELSTVTDIRPLVVETMLTYLEMEGILEERGASHTILDAKLARGVGPLLAGYDARRRSFLKKLFEAAEERRTGYRFTIDKVAERLACPMKKVLSALAELEEAGDLKLKKSGWRKSYRRGRNEATLGELKERMQEKLRRRAEADLARIRQVIELAESRGCLTARVAKHFGETLKGGCGHCDRCAGVPVKKVPGGKVEEPGRDERERVLELVREGHAALRSPRQLARFLCGIRSPAAGRARLTRHDLFGVWERIPFARVLELTESTGF